MLFSGTCARPALHMFHPPLLARHRLSQSQQNLAWEAVWHTVATGVQHREGLRPSADAVTGDHVL